jgi:hypothetical protein
MSTVQRHHQLSEWQLERAKRLQRACLSIQRARQRGEQLGRVIRRVARRCHGRPFQCAPHRSLKLSAVTLRRLWDAWRRGGEVPAAFTLHFKPGARRIPQTVLVRFVNFSAGRQYSSLAAALRAFNAGPRRVTVKQRPLGYDALRRALPKKCFPALRRQIVAAHSAAVELNKLRLAFIGEIENRAVPKPPRRRLPGNYFEI